MTTPLVSCLMPTYNRRSFIAHAIAYFQHQTYENRELIILDDGEDSIVDLIPADSSIRYERLPRKITLGAKLNLACEMARGDIIAHFDDDDWYAAWRLTYQVEALTRSHADLCGINQLLYYDLRDGRGYEYRYPPDRKTWLIGSDLVYTKLFWRTHRFAEIDVGMDGIFSWSAERDRIKALENRDFAVHMIHSANVSPKQVNGAHWCPHPTDDIARAMGEDWAFYRLDDRQIRSAPNARPRTQATPASPPSLATKPLRNVFACLVHEKPECVIDLVSNLRRLDPQSRIVLYDGGAGGGLLDQRLPWARWGAEVVANPRPMTWGRLHAFALDCLRHLGSADAFDLMTIVDSDQLALRPGYSEFLSRRLGSRSGLGLLSPKPEVQERHTKIAPCVSAHQEIELWRPFLKRFPDGEAKFVHWSFWPSTVISADAGIALLDLFDQDKELANLLEASRLWATEEILFPTLAALLGFRIERNPCAGDFVKFRAKFAICDLEEALAHPDAFFMHPVAREYADPIRTRLRRTHDDYRSEASSPAQLASAAPLLLTPILRHMRGIDGWLDDEEAELLAVITREILTNGSEPKQIVEIGSHCGKATYVLAAVAQACDPRTHILAVDNFDGIVGALDGGLQRRGPTLEKFKRMLAETQLTQRIEISVGPASIAVCERPVDLILVDGLHDYASVAQDFHAFSDRLAPNATVAFHDYADYFPGVRRFVDELLPSGDWTLAGQIGSLVVLRKACSL